MENENKEFEIVEILEDQVETGIEYNEVTNDDTVQDTFNVDGFEELISEGAEIVNE
jgi:hypothetical protein